MNLLSYVQSLHARLSRPEIAKTIELTLDEVRKYTLPAYASAESVFTTFKFQSSDAKAYAMDFRRMAGGGEMIGTIHGAFTNALSLLSTLEANVDMLFADQEASTALTYQKATYLQVVSAISFASGYARKFLNHLYILETASAGETDVERQSPAEIDYVVSYFNAFCACVKVMLLDFANIEKGISAMPEAVVSQLSEQTLPHTLGKAKMDPLGLQGFTIPISVSVKWNPFYLIGTVIASIQVACYKAAKEELDLLQMRKLNLERLHEKKPDARLQQEIEHMSARVVKLQYELQKSREAYSV